MIVNFPFNDEIKSFKVKKIRKQEKINLSQVTIFMFIFKKRKTIFIWLISDVISYEHEKDQKRFPKSFYYYYYIFFFIYLQLFFKFVYIIIIIIIIIIILSILWGTFKSEV